MWWWERKGASVVERSLLEEYGSVVRWNGALGVRSFLWSQALDHLYANATIQENRLWIADPKAVHHIHQAACYQCEKPSHTKGLVEMLIDRGLVSVEGELTLTLHVVKPF
jgi:hypothetical protein